MFRFGIGALVIGGGLLIVGCMEWNVSRKSSKQPEEVSLKDAIGRGVEGNPNIILKDFRLCENFVYEENATTKAWNKVWVPVVVSGQGGPGIGTGPQGIEALIFSIEVRNVDDLRRRCDVPKLRALITNKIVSVGAGEKKLLQQAYPSANIDRCLIIQEGREPAGAGKLFFMIGGGSLGILTGLGLFVGAWMQRQQDSAPSRKKKKKKSRAVVEEVEDDDDEPPPRKASIQTAGKDRPTSKPARRPAPASDIVEDLEIVEDDPPPKKKPLSRPRPRSQDDEEEPPRPRPRPRRPDDD